MRKHKCPQAAFLSMLVALAASAQPPAQDAQTPAPPAPPPWSAGGIDFSGYVDVYANLNFNNPASGFNGDFVRTYDVKANTFSLNMATLTMQHAADPIGFRVDLGFGRGFDVYNAYEPLADNRGGITRNIMQAFVSVKPKNAGGLQIDFGKFVTSAGAELTETHLNWNYSRSLVYSLGPFYHTGLRMSKPITGKWTAGFQAVNGWNNTDDNNTGKTFGLTSAYVGSKAGYFVNYYVGPEKTGTNQGYRHFIDQVLTLTPHPKASFYLNYDYGFERAADGSKAIISAIAGAAKFQVNDWFALSPRFEYFNDRATWTTGVPQKLKEATFTAEFKHSKGFMTKIEYRHDWSNVPWFDNQQGKQMEKSQDTLLVGFIAFFGPK